jgi:hypothetical protein
MKTLLPVVGSCFALEIIPLLYAAETVSRASPADNLPPHIRQVTWFGERADWSHDGKRILFLSKTFGCPCSRESLRRSQME